MSIFSLINKTIYDIIWEDADDVIERTVYLSELYENVPKEISDVQIRVLEIHEIQGKKKQKVLKWLNGRRD